MGRHTWELRAFLFKLFRHSWWALRAKPITYMESVGPIYFSIGGEPWPQGERCIWRRYHIIGTKPCYGRANAGRSDHSWYRDGALVYRRLWPSTAADDPEGFLSPPAELLNSFADAKFDPKFELVLYRRSTVSYEALKIYGPY